MEHSGTPYSYRPKKSLGQNFLTSIPARLAIVGAGHLTSEDTVLEIGPGKGFLTRGLLDSGAKVVALEKDRDLLLVLAETFAAEIANNQLTLIEGDVLEFNPKEHGLRKGEYKIIANIPYYITGAILSQFLSSPDHPSQMVVLIQKEVAERIVARDGKASILSLSVHAYGTPSIVYRVNKGSFFPIPSVDSAVLSIETISRAHFTDSYHEAIFFKLVKAGFLHKRKFLLSNIQEVFPTVNIRDLFIEQKLSEKVRAEDVTLPVWISLAKALCLATSTAS